MKKMNGFTLIELMIVVAIIGILAAVVVPMIPGFEKSKVKQISTSTTQTRHVSSQVQAEAATQIFACADGILYIDNVKSNKNCKNSITGIEIIQ